ncbi:hypothetical protein JCM11641_000342 [Rhodosporidiobolus odoratus]
MSTASSSSPSRMGEPVVLEPLNGRQARGTVIWSHRTLVWRSGLGDSAQGWLDFAETMRRREALKGVRWVVTNAPEREVTVNRGDVMQAWYDITQPNTPPVAEDVNGMLESVRAIQGLVEREVEKGVREEKIVVGGFSHEKRLGGICVLSGFLALTHKDQIKPLVSPASASTPIFWGHGTADQAIHFSRAQQGREYLRNGLKREEGEMFDFRKYEGMEHTLGSEELGDVVEWLEKVLKE